MPFFIVILSCAILLIESVIFELWKNERKKALLCHIISWITGNIAAFCITILWKKQTAYEYLLVYSIVSVICAAFASKLSNKSKETNHVVLKAVHPSPLSAYRGFFGCKHFSTANRVLMENGEEPIDWQIENI